jgi:hypothetical protein
MRLLGTGLEIMRGGEMWMTCEDQRSGRSGTVHYSQNEKMLQSFPLEAYCRITTTKAGASSGSKEMRRDA